MKLRRCPLLTMLVAIPLAMTAPIAAHADEDLSQDLYVSMDGSNASPGTAADPFGTIGHALTVAAPGQRIIVRGGTYPGFAARSGAPGLPITVAGAPGEHVLVDGAGRWASIDLSGVHDVRLQNLTVTGSRGNWSAGVMVRDGSSSIRLDQVRSTDNALFGIRIARSSDVVVRGADLSRNAVGAMIESTGGGVVVADSVLHENTKMITNDVAADNDSGAVGLAVMNNVGDVTVTRNDFFANRAASYDYGFDGGAVEIYGASNVTITRNRMWDNQNVLETGTGGSACAGNRFTRNVAFGGNDKALVKDWRSPQANGLLLRCAKDMLVAHNTLHDLDGFSYWLNASDRFAGSLENMRIVNDVAKQRSAPVFHVDGSLPSSLRVSRVLAHRDSGPLAYVAGRGTTTSGATFTSWTGLNKDGIYKDPQFTDALKRDYKLRLGSPAVDAARELVEASTSYLGKGYDLGAVESR